ncbi:MAG: FtsX-like permease family protein [Planctomycetes bacterium]|nr:FtsX-like permease family protein [Planctomycetota bacterium]
MNSLWFAFRSIRCYRYTSAALLLSVAAGTAVLTGSLLVGDSVRHTLALMVNYRLGDADHVLAAPHFFTETLGDRLAAAGGGKAVLRAGSFLRASGSCVMPSTGAVAAGLNVYGCRSVEPGTCAISGRLARQLQAKVGDVLVFKADPLARANSRTLFTATDRDFVSLRLRVAEIAGERSFRGAFSLQNTQRPLKNAWVPLAEFQETLHAPGHVNILLLAAAAPYRGEDGAALLQESLSEAVTAEDYGLRFRRGGNDCLVLETDRVFFQPALDKALEVSFPRADKVLSYLADTIRDSTSGRECPYSMVAGISHVPGGPIDTDGIVLNRWLSADLHAAVGDEVALSCRVKGDTGLASEFSRRFTVGRVIDASGIGVDETLVPRYDAITGAVSISDWKPPREFDIDLRRIRPADEDYWKSYGAAPKAFIRLDAARQMWASPYGGTTSRRLAGVDEDGLRAALTASVCPEDAGLVIEPIRARMSAVSAGNTDFGRLFAGLSFMLVVSSALLVVLVMLLAVEKRAAQAGLMRAVGFSAGAVFRLFVVENVLILAPGVLVGTVLSAACARLMLWGLATVWNTAVGMSFLELSITVPTLVVGASAGVAVGLTAVWAGVHRLRNVQIAEAVSGKCALPPPHASALFPFLGGAAALLAAAVTVFALFSGAAHGTPLFYAAGVLLMVASLAGLRMWLGRAASARTRSVGSFSAAALAVKNAARSPARSILVAGLVAVASFVFIATSSMKSTRRITGGDFAPYGGYSLIVESDIPVPYDISTADGRRLLALPEEDFWTRIRIDGLRSSDGEDVSCRNLYSPSDPRVTSVPDAIMDADAFAFAASAEAVPDPWTLLRTELPDGAVPAVADYETARWILHRDLGDVVEVTDENGRPVRLRLVAFLRKSFFQSELLVDSDGFAGLFPGFAGYNKFLVKASLDDMPAVARTLRSGLADFGVTVETTPERMASFTRVADSYISAFQVLGGLGVFMGAFGLLAVLLKGVLERRAELALLSALGFRRGTVAWIVAAENLLLLAFGFAAGTLSALLAVYPEFLRSTGDTAAVLRAACALLAMLVLAAVPTFVAGLVLVRKIAPAALRME